jgi:hypothetical protein
MEQVEELAEDLAVAIMQWARKHQYVPRISYLDAQRMAEHSADEVERHLRVAPREAPASPPREGA